MNIAFLELDASFIRVGKFAAFFDHMTPAKRGCWFDFQRTGREARIGFFMWDIFVAVD